MSALRHEPPFAWRRTMPMGPVRISASDHRDETLRISLSETIEIDCLLPVVVNVRFAEKPGASTVTAIRSPFARPCNVPLTPREASLHEPDTRPPSLTTSLLSSIL